MINHQQITDVNGEKLVITVRPNASLSKRDLVRFGWFIGLAILLVAGYAAFNGIVFALYFALAEIPLVLLLLVSVVVSAKRLLLFLSKRCRSKKLGCPLRFYRWRGLSVSFTRGRMATTM